jgi:tetratricopeptide (TPR) repeat protein
MEYGFVKKSIAHVRKITVTLETIPVGLFRWLVLFYSIVLIRNLLESFSGHSPVNLTVDFFLHFPLAFINPLMALTILFALLSGEKIVRITKIMLVMWSLVLIPPLVDLFTRAFATGEKASLIGYLYIPEGRYGEYLLNFFNPAHQFRGTTAGIRVEAFIACSLASVYVYMKRRKLWLLPVSFFLVYLVSLFFFTFPYSFFYLVSSSSGSPEVVKNFFLREGTILRHPFDKISFSFAQIQLFLTAILSLLWFSTYSRKKIAALFAFLPFRTMCTGVLLLLAGFFLSNRILFTPENPFRFTHPYDVVSFISLLLSCFYLFVFLRFVETRYADAVGPPGQGNILNTLSGDEIHGILLLSLVLSFTLASVIHYTTGIIMTVLLGLGLLCMVPPFRIMDIPVVSSISKSLFAFLLFFWGFSLNGKGNSVIYLPHQWIIGLIIGFSVSLLCTDVDRFSSRFGKRVELQQKIRRLTSRKGARLVLAALLAAGPLLFAVLVKERNIFITSLVFSVFLFALNATSLKRKATSMLLMLFLVLQIFAIHSSKEIAPFTPTDSVDVRRHKSLAAKFRWEGMREYGMSEYEKAVEKGTRDLEVYSTLCFFTFADGDTLKTLNYAREAANNNPHNSKAYILLGNYQLKSGKPDASLLSYRNAAKIDSTDVEAWLKTGTVLETLGRTSEAEEVYRDALRVIPSGKKLLSAYYRINLQRIRDVEPIEIDSLKKSLRENPGAIEPGLKLAVALEKSNQSEEALEALYAARRIAPDDPRVSYLIGIQHLNSNSLEKAETQMRSFIETVPWMIEGYMALTSILLQKDELEEASTVLKEVIDKWPAEGQVKLNLGMLYLNMGQRARGIQQFREALASGDIEHSVLKALAMTLFEIDEGELGKWILDELLSLSPLDVKANLMLADRLFEEKRFRYALTYYRQVVDLDPKMVKGWYRLGVCYYLTGEKKEARRSFEECLRVRPDFTPAREKLDIILAEE